MSMKRNFQSRTFKETSTSKFKEHVQIELLRTIFIFGNLGDFGNFAISGNFGKFWNLGEPLGAAAVAPPLVIE